MDQQICTSQAALGRAEARAATLQWGLTAGTNVKYAEPCWGQVATGRNGAARRGGPGRAAGRGK